ncbi:MAG: hypothetical protein IJ172_00350 [Ruminococcus sp.]|nr:hypothetical protein [Ruminococcus sp.]MBQ8119215.1 hypothetical protein [Ruminococcus sp.]
MRLIDADTAEKKLAELVEIYEKRMPKWSPNDMLTSGRDAALKHGYKADGVEKALETIKDMPTVEVAPVKRARWIKGKNWDDWFCSGCSNKADLDWRENPILSSFCPHCGAIMYIKDGEGEIAADPLVGTVVDREQFNRAANEIGDSIEDGNDKMAIAVFVNELEEKLFGGAENG